MAESEEILQKTWEKDCRVPDSNFKPEVEILSLNNLPV